MQEDLQKRVEAVHVEASAGGGMVTVRMNGQKVVTEVRIEPDASPAPPLRWVAPHRTAGILLRTRSFTGKPICRAETGSSGFSWLV